MARRIDLDQIIMSGTPGDFVVMTNTGTGVLETVDEDTFKLRFDVGSGTGNISGSGTTGTIAKFTAGGVIGDAAFTEAEVVTTNTAQSISAAKTFATGTLQAADIDDSNGDELLTFTSSTTPVNYFDMASADTGNRPTLSAAGDDANIDLKFSGKGTGNVLVKHGGQPDSVIAGVDSALTQDFLAIGSSNQYNLTTSGSFAISDVARLSQSQTFTGTPTFGNEFVAGGVLNTGSGIKVLFQDQSLNALGTNYVSIYNSATAGGVAGITTLGQDTDIDLQLSAKGAGIVEADQGNGYKEVAVKEGAFTTGDLVQVNASGELVSAGAGADTFVTLTTAQNISGTKTFTVAQNFNGNLNLADGVNISGAGTHQVAATNALTLASSTSSVTVSAATQTSILAGTGNVVIDSTGGEIQLNTTIANDAGDMLIQPTGNLDLDAAVVEIVQGVINSGLGQDLILDADANDIVIGGARLTTADVDSAASEDLVLRSGNTTTSGDSGDVNIDVGTAAGTNGNLILGAANASAITIGQVGTTTTNAGDMVVSGDLTVNGTTTTVNSSTLTVADKNIDIGYIDGGTSETDATANGGGITLWGTTNKTLLWDDPNDNWSSNQSFNLTSGNVYKINNVEVLSATALGSSVTTASGLTSASSLATVGTITSGTWNATEIGVVYGGTGLTSIAQHDVIYGSAANTFSTASLDATSGAVILGNTGAGVAPIDEAALVANFKLYRRVERFTIANTVAADSGDLGLGTGSYFKLDRTPFDGRSITIRAVQGGYQNNKTVDGTDADFEYNLISSEDRIYVANHTGDGVSGLGSGQIVNGDELEIEYFTTQP